MRVIKQNSNSIEGLITSCLSADFIITNLAFNYRASVPQDPTASNEIPLSVSVLNKFPIIIFSTEQDNGIFMIRNVGELMLARAW